ncbi:Crp/Fnr family transcriptional regulator [Fredinandcohnia sp. QZ13]|uniref:Crp/Fnr family transcriptional regulator n=1 Tax=Fredinandcohnia sp. QZ13 TaxID=3073144 RepID=UPI00285322F7|nr:Crp/Fnr family transcriptional regulator [Fredinandcohnia sp. QZ13]MDR4888005.1 Crp/Fnr family transcriptional regulator [Fredinandcohnia sp. QZ13]
MKNSCISRVPIFNHLTENEMAEISQVAISKRLKKGELLFHSVELSEQLFIVHKGLVKMYRITENGKEQIIRFVEEGDFIGELSLFSKTMTTSFAEAMEDTEVCTIQQQDIHQLLLRYPTISLKILEEFTSRLHETESLIEKLNSQDVEKRVASYLVELIEGQEDDSMTIHLPIRKGDLASYLGTSQETLSRRLSAFQNQGLIELKGQRKIIIKQLEELRKKANN